QIESPVAVRRDVGAGGDVGGEAEERHEHPGLAGDVGAQVPGVAGREQGGGGDRVHVGDPLLGGFATGFDGVVAVSAQVVQAVADPLDVVLDRRDHVGEDGRAARPGDDEQVREPGDAQPEIGAGSFGPRLLQHDTVTAPDVD